MRKILDPKEQARMDRLREQEARMQANLLATRLDDLDRQVGSRYRGATLKGWQFHGEPDHRQDQASAVSHIAEYGAALHDNIHQGRNLVLHGPAGTGKDHLLAALAYHTVRSGFRVRWTNGPDLFGTARDRIGSNASEAELLASLTGPDVLVLSDPTTPGFPLTGWQAQLMYRIVDGRYRRQRPTWVSLNVRDGHEAETLLGVATVDRLRHDAIALECNWPSFRKPQVNE